MHRQNLLNLLHSYHPSNSDERESKKLMISFVNNNPECFERSLLSGHMTASAWLLNFDRSKVLLMHHAKLNKWVQLGGHCDGQTDILAVAIKEAQEESGVDAIVPLLQEIFDIDIHWIPEHKGTPAHWHYDVRFLLGVVHSDNIVQNSESKELRWVGKDRSLLPTDSVSITRMFDKWCAL